MRDGKAAQNSPHRLPARCYGLAITIGLSAALWAIVIGIAVLLL